MLNRRDVLQATVAATVLAANAAEIVRFLGQRNPPLRCVGDNSSFGPYL